MARRVLSVLLAGLLCGCAAPYSMSLPPSFKKFEDTRDFKLVSADGVMVKVREEKNYPEAELEFWVDAMKKHLDERGYTFKDQRAFDTTSGHKACTLSFVLPHGAQDWVMSETIIVIDDRLVLVEAAAPFERFSAVEQELRKALLTFDPGH
ncbi:MAG: hypothetical protein MUC50_19920 [Myxococcota bacterium]|nr:hypothetical protein [Myxococcota bacterium]